MSTKTLVLAGLMTALVIVFQYLASSMPGIFGPFNTAIGLVPIAIGAILCGPIVGGWLGLVFGAVVLLSGGANLFFAFNIPGTIITVLLKGAACGFAAGLVNKLLSRFNKIVAVFAAAIVCPVVNTGVFLLGSAIFFMPYAEEIATEAKIEGAGFAVFIAMAFANFLFELGMNTVLSPVMVTIINVAEKTFKKNKKQNKAEPAKASEESKVEEPSHEAEPEALSESEPSDSVNEE